MNTSLPRPPLALVVATQLFLGVLFGVGVAAIVLLPGVAASVAETLPEYTDLRGPVLASSIGFIALGLITIALISLLVHRIYRGTMLSKQSVIWVDALVAILVCAALQLVSVAAVISGGQAGSPFLALILAMGILALLTIAGITLVLRSLLRSAIAMRAELDEVV
jgi:MFS family permease